MKKLRWAPDIIHCQGWISHLVPVYLKKAYKDDPIFASSKIVLSLYDDTPEADFSQDFAQKACFGPVVKEDVSLLEKATGINLARTAVQYSDGVILGSGDVKEDIVSYARQLGLPLLPYNGEALENGAYVDDYCAFYDKI